MMEATFRSEDRQYGLTLPEREISRVLTFCRAAGSRETGGVLVGRYNETHDCAIVLSAEGPPSDSKSGSTWFERGVRGLRRMFTQRWRRNEYYLGEWHFHPGGAPAPSATDTMRMKRIADAVDYHCPEPVLLIVAGPAGQRWHLGAFVYAATDHREVRLAPWPMCIDDPA